MFKKLIDIIKNKMAEARFERAYLKRLADYHQLSVWKIKEIILDQPQVFQETILAPFREAVRLGEVTCDPKDASGLILVPKTLRSFTRGMSQTSGLQPHSLTENLEDKLVGKTQDYFFEIKKIVGDHDQKAFSTFFYQEEIPLRLFLGVISHVQNPVWLIFLVSVKLRLHFMINNPQLTSSNTHSHREELLLFAEKNELDKVLAMELLDFCFPSV